MHHGAYARSDTTGSPCSMGRMLSKMVQVLHAPWSVRLVTWYRFAMRHGAYARSDTTGSPCTMGHTLSKMVQTLHALWAI